MASLVRQAVLAVLRATLPRRVMMTRGRRGGRSVFLTFDDGPDPETTPAILDTLARHGAKATFFVVGERVAAHPELVRRMVDEGHAVGGHTYWHRPPASVSAAQMWAEIEATDELLAPMLGGPPRLFRPPLGKLTPGKLVRLALRRRTIVLWSQDPKDYAAESPESICEWFERSPWGPGDIVLLHDTSRATAAALDELLRRNSTHNFRPLLV